MDLSEVGADMTRRHPWERARSRFFLTLLEQQNAFRTADLILDVGAGDAWLAQQLIGVLPEAAAITCWDVNYTEAGAEVKTIDEAGLVLTAERPTGRFNGILMLDVIEHVEDDVGFVRSIVQELLDDGGWVLVSVPAYQRLFTSHDTALQHFRRYSPAQCRSVLEAAGLRPILEGGLFQSLLLVRGIQAARELVLSPATSHGVGAWGGGEVLTKWLTQWLDFEGRLSLEAAMRTNYVLPGLSYWAYCTAPDR